MEPSCQQRWYRRYKASWYTHTHTAQMRVCDKMNALGTQSSSFLIWPGKSVKTKEFKTLCVAFLKIICVYVHCSKTLSGIIHPKLGFHSFLAPKRLWMWPTVTARDVRCVINFAVLMPVKQTEMSPTGFPFWAPLLTFFQINQLRVWNDSLCKSWVISGLTVFTGYFIVHMKSRLKWLSWHCVVVLNSFPLHLLTFFTSMAEEW